MVDLIESFESSFCHKCMEDNDCDMCMDRCYEYRFAQDVIEESVKEWLSSFDTNSATECFTAVNLLKQRLEGEK